jgi:hypothetical protein
VSGKGKIMSTAPVPTKRFALSLPAGSVRAIHVLCIVGLVCAMVIMGKIVVDESGKAVGVPTIPPYLVYLLFLMVGHYFAAHGVSIATRDDPSPSPLYLPGGTVRVLIWLALVASVSWKIYQDSPALVQQFETSLDRLKDEPILPLVILGGFFLGTIVRSITVRIAPRPAFQDMEAWISLIALLMIAIAGVIHLVVDPSLERTLYMPVWESFVGGAVAFYFGERS